MNSKLKNPRSDPDVWITQLEDLQAQINGSKPDSITEDDLIEHVLGNLPSVYDIEIHTLRKRLDDLNNPLTIEEVREELNLKFKMMNKQSCGNPGGENEETALFVGGFKGKCNACGKFGHRSRECRSKGTNSSLQASVKQMKSQTNNSSADQKDKNVECFYCKRKGHRIAECLKLKRKEQATLAWLLKKKMMDLLSNPMMKKVALGLE